MTDTDTPPLPRRRHWGRLLLTLFLAAVAAGAWLLYRLQPQFLSTLTLPHLADALPASTPSVPPLAPLIAPSPPTAASDTQNSREEIETLRQENENLRQRLTQQNSAPLLTALWPLQQKLESGHPFQQELITFKKQIITHRADAALWEEAEALEADARHGVATSAALREGLRPLAGLLVAEQPQAGHSNRVMRWFQQAIRLRAIDPNHTSTPLESLLIQCDQALLTQSWEKARHDAEAIAQLWPPEADSATLQHYRQWVSQLQQAAIARQRIGQLYHTIVEPQP